MWEHPVGFSTTVVLTFFTNLTYEDHVRVTTQRTPQSVRIGVGIQTDLACRVLRSGDGEPIDGLYAVGEAAGFGGGGLHGKRALEGTFLGGCVFTGRTAAAAIAGIEVPAAAGAAQT